MYSLTILVITGVIALAAGITIGMLLDKRLSADARSLRETERELDRTRQEKRAYEEEVVEHFTQAASLLNTLTDSYRDVHNHLASGAAHLCQERGPVSLVALENRSSGDEIPANLAQVTPPLDYAPKTSPQEKGMLNEEFGIDRDQKSLAARTATD